MTDAVIRAFCAEQRELLRLELQSEQDEAAQVETSSHGGSGGGGGKGSSSSVRGPEEVTRSHVLHQLDAADISVGLYGRTVVRLVASTAAAAASAGPLDGQVLLPAHRFTTGDEVEIRTKTEKTGVGGVVSEVTEHAISVALFSSNNKRNDDKKKSNNKNDKGNADDDDDSDNMLGSPPYSLLPKSSIEVHKKMLQALDELEKHGIDHPVAGKVVRALFDPSTVKECTFQLKPTNSTVETTETSSDVIPAQHGGSAEKSSGHRGGSSSSRRPLDDSQREAVEFALNNNLPFALVHGPPGSGKTTTVVELIRQAVQQHGYRVLVTAPSNVAVDNVLARLVASSSLSNMGPVSSKKKSSSSSSASSKLRVVRLGHPARLQADILPYSLEAVVQAAEGTELVADARKELQSFLKVSCHPRTRYADKVVARREIRTLRSEIRNRERAVVKHVMHQAQVILATCVGAAHRQLLGDEELTFDLVVVDEAAQALEAACWIPALRGSRLVLAGDHCQLPPTIKCNDSRVQKLLGRTMFERVMELYGDDPARVSRMLQVQYRMNQTIADWASNALYGGKLSTHESARDRVLAQLEGYVEPSSDHETDGISKTPLLLIDTAGCDMYESTNAAGSRFNQGEAQLVEQHVRKLLELGVKATEIAVISPYNGQVEILRSALLPDIPQLEIRTVDGFQGGERDAVVLSLVRSSTGSGQKGGGAGIGFLRDDRRLNVAVTRAKRHCCVICDTETVSQSPFVQNLILWIEEHGEQRSAMEYLAANDNEVQISRDLVQAQMELEKLLLADEKKDRSSSSTGKNKVGKDKGMSQSLRDENSSPQRIALLASVRSFAQTGKPGEEMLLSTELSKGDRKALNELAEELGLGHVSTGVEGVDRRITLHIPTESSMSQQQVVPQEPATERVDGVSGPTVVEEDEAPDSDDSDHDGVDDDADDTKPSTSFAALQPSNDGDDNDDEADEEEDEPPEVHTQDEPTMDPMNNVLATLAKERAQREQQKAREMKNAQKNPPKKPTSKPNKKAHKLGGTTTTTTTKASSDDASNAIEDDMAFLDAQIQKVQNSHGRKIEGKGTNFRTVMNGILIAKPNPPPERKKDPKASAALQTKLKQAQNDRKAKAKKKK